MACMTLRTKLVLAFVFLAVIPLVVVTLYSHAGSVDALRRTVERESGAVAERMGQRMELVAADLRGRVEELGTLPFGPLADVETGSEAIAGDFAAEVAERMGERAMLVESLEFVPAEAMTAALGTPWAALAESEAGGGEKRRGRRRRV